MGNSVPGFAVFLAAAGVLYSVSGLLLSPIFVGATMALHPVSVVTNAWRHNRARL